MLVSDFNFDLPSHLIAQYPSKKRDKSKLLILDRARSAISHCQFTDIINQMEMGDLLVINDTKTMQARLFGHKVSGAKVEILITKLNSNTQAQAMICCNRAPKKGSLILLQNNVTATVIDRQDDEFSLNFSLSIVDYMSEYGVLPLPSYINRPVNQQDKQRYQTIYAEKLGSVATPTAGLHFSESVLEQLRQKQIQIEKLTLHVGLGTFRPIRTKVVEQYQIHSEQVHLPGSLIQAIRRAKQKGGRVIAVGTTCARALESFFHQVMPPPNEASDIKEITGEADLFLYPGKPFRLIDGVITNFHLPKSTLFIMICAFSSVDTIKLAYQKAIENEYRFFSYGDAMFIS